MQLRDDFVETPPLPPDAIAWVVSDFQRESLEPSAAYQVASTETPILYIRKTKAPLLPDHFTFRTDKRPIKSLFSASLKKLTTADQLAKNSTENPIVNGTNANHTAVDHSNGIHTAPSYTFYASKKILERSGFVLHTSRDVLEYLQTWLGVAYPLAKLGMINL